METVTFCGMFQQMRKPIPAVVVPLVALMLYFFVPGVRESPLTAVRTSGAVLGHRFRLHDRRQGTAQQIIRVRLLWNDGPTSAESCV
jgi:hypothetical protein